MGDSIPEVAVGKLHEENGRMIMSVSIEVNHGLVDGRHIGLFVDTLPSRFLVPTAHIFYNGNKTISKAQMVSQIMSLPELFLETTVCQSVNNLLKSQ